MITDPNVANQIALSFSSDRLKLTLLPTEQCNFRCKYCYEDFKIGRMSRSVIDGVKELIENRATDLAFLEIEWFGGEPLVARDIVVEIQSFAQKIATSNGISFRSGMTTNGYLLTSDIMRQLTSIGISQYQISLDGFGDRHDATRVLGSGAGSFDRLWANLLRLSEIDTSFSIMLRVHITASNLLTVEEDVEQIASHLGHDSRFSFFFKPVGNLGGPTSVKAAVPDRFAAKEVTGRLRSRFSENKAVRSFNLCYAAMPNAFVIRANGTVAKCTVAFSSESNNLGNIDRNGKMDIDVARMNRWFKGYESLDLAALGCPLHALSLY